VHNQLESVLWCKLICGEIGCKKVQATRTFYQPASVHKGSICLCLAFLAQIEGEDRLFGDGREERKLPIIYS